MPSIDTPELNAPGSALLLCDASRAEALSRQFSVAIPENRAPFRGWRCADEGRRVLLLSVGPEPSAAAAGALLLVDRFPRIPITLLTSARACDADLPAQSLYLCDPIGSFDKTEFYLLSSAPAPSASRLSLRADGSLMEKAAIVFPDLSPVVLGSCPVHVDFDVQARWLFRQYQYRLCDNRAFEVARILSDRNRPWAVLAYLSSEPNLSQDALRAMKNYLLRTAEDSQK